MSQVQRNQEREMTKARPPTGMLRLRPQVRNYDWGSSRALPELLGRANPLAEPQAELWMGTHASAPSDALVAGDWIPLETAIGGPLPYLFKVLAAEKALSIQAHPDSEQARRGFEREEAWGVERNAKRRNYRDPNPKPEIVYALTAFHVLSGFRPPAAIVQTLDTLGLCELPGAAALGMNDASQALAGFLCDLLEAPEEDIAPFLERAVEAAARHRDHPPENERCHWLDRLAEQHPGDRGLLAPLFLELTTLSPGQALYTAPGTLHAYLEGSALELMTSSDNVLRGGLTKKHVDVPELLSVLRFEPESPRLLEAVTGASGEEIFTSPKGRLVLGHHRVRAGESLVLDPEEGSLLLCTEGSAQQVSQDGSPAAAELGITKGDSFFLAPRGHGSTLELRAGEAGATLFQAFGRGLGGDAGRDPR